MKFSFHKQSFIFFLILLLLESAIALFVRDSFIRPFVGDVLVIWLIYFFIGSFWQSNQPARITIGIFLFACLIELGQYFNLASLLKLKNNPIAHVIIGATFDWLDILAYGIGVVLLLAGHFDYRA